MVVTYRQTFAFLSTPSITTSSGEVLSGVYELLVTDSRKYNALRTDRREIKALDDMIG